MTENHELDAATIRELLAKITQGEWHNEGNVVVDEQSVVVGTEAYNWRFVAHVNSDNEPEMDHPPETPEISAREAKANADFIAAAPAIARYALELSDKWDAALQLVRARVGELKRDYGDQIQQSTSARYTSARIDAVTELLQELEQLEKK